MINTRILVNSGIDNHVLGFPPPVPGQQKQVDPEVFRFFYTIWKETEAEAQDVDLPASVLEHLETNECVYKLSSSVKTSHGVGKIAMTQRRLFLLTDGRPGYVEITKFRDIEVSGQSLVMAKTFCHGSGPDAPCTCGPPLVQLIKTNSIPSGDRKLGQTVNRHKQLGVRMFKMKPHVALLQQIM